MWQALWEKFARLWEWFKRKFQKKVGGFSARERAIFGYFDGSVQRWIDPFEVQRSLEKHGGKNWMELFTGLNLGGGIGLDKLSPQIRESVSASYQNSITKLSDLVRLAFHVSPLKSLDGKPIGLVDSECIDLLFRFINWLSDLEEEFRPLLLPPMESAGPLEGESTIEPSLVSPAITIESDESEPKKSPGESELLFPKCGA